MSLPVQATPEADPQILEIDNWWRRNQLAAPDLFFDELTASFDVIRHTPQIGRLYRQSPVPGTRRILLEGTRYHVYYAARAGEVRVLAGWMLSAASGRLCGCDRQPLQGVRVKPRLSTLVVSMHPAAQFARRARGAGAIGYLTKDSSPEEFVKAIENARRGRRYLGRDAGDVLLNWTAKSLATPHDSLSDREYQVLRLLGSGQTTSDIARDLGLSVKTVSTYRTRVLVKLGMRTSPELMRYAIENGLLNS